MLPARDFIFVRHGETDFNREHRIAGHTDVPLNAEGRRQAEAAAAALAGMRIVRIVHSPLVRARDTARAIAARNGAPLSVDPDLAECRWGAMEGQVTPPGDFGWADAWSKGEGPEGAESFVEFAMRVRRAMAAAIVAPDDGPVAVVSHGGVWRVLRETLGHAPAFGGRNAEPMLCEPPSKSGQPWRIVPL